MEEVKEKPKSVFGNLGPKPESDNSKVTNSVDQSKISATNILESQSIDAPASDGLIAKMSLSDLEKLELNSQTLDNIFNGFFSKVETHSKRFEDMAKKLKQDEIDMLQTISTFESLKSYSEKAIHAYGESQIVIQDIAQKQTQMMQQLEELEREVDLVADHYMPADFMRGRVRDDKPNLHQKTQLLSGKFVCLNLH